MGTEATTAGDEKTQEQAWKDAGADRTGMPPPTGASVASSDAERDMIRGFQERGMVGARPQKEPSVDEQRRMMHPDTASGGEPAPAAPVRDESFTPPAEKEPELAPRQRPVVPPPVDDEGAELERTLLTAPSASGGLDDLPDTMVKVGGKEIPLSRIRAGLAAEANRDKWTSELTREQQALARANDTMIDAAREFHKDAIGALEKIGVPPDKIVEQLRARGMLDAPAAKTVDTLPEDADPLAKALYAENQALKRQNAGYGREIEGIKQHLASSDQQSKAAALRSQQAAALSGAKSELTAMAAKMPSMQESVGKLNVTGKLLVDKVSTQLAQEVTAYGRPVDAAQLRPRALQIFSEIAREVGITPKAQQARNALARRSNPTPTQTGTTVATPNPGAEKTKPGSFDFSNDEARRAAMDAWWETQAAT